MEHDHENPICIVQRQSDGSFAYAHGGEVIELGGTLPRAVGLLDRMGIHATHWLPMNPSAQMTTIPGGIVRRHLSAEGSSFGL